MNPPSPCTHQVELAEPCRIDRYIAEIIGACTRSQLKTRLLHLTVNRKPAKLGQLVKSGDVLSYELAAPEELSLVPEAMELDILYEDDDVIVINKPTGLVVHPAAGNHTGTLVHGILYHTKELAEADFDDAARPGIVHRLDKETSGVMIVAKDERCHAYLAAQFAARSTDKRYLALAWGAVPSNPFSVKGCIRRDPRQRQRFAWHESEGKAAHTDFSIRAHNGKFQLLEAHLHTGRTHQIRVHLNHAHVPIIGDTVYGVFPKGVTAARCMLHAWKLSIKLPSDQEMHHFTAVPPQDFAACAASLSLAIPGNREQA